MLLFGFVGVLVERVSRVWEYKCLCQTSVSLGMTNMNIVLGGSFRVRNSDSWNCNHCYMVEPI